MQHNPVAIAISSIQEQWHTQITPDSDFKVIRWLINSDENALINGFLKLESSVHGSCDDFFMVLFTPYNTAEEIFSLSLIKDIFHMWDNDSDVKKVGLEWDRSAFTSRMKATEAKAADILLIDILTDFKQQFCKKDQRLVLGLIPSTVDENSELNRFIVRMANMLPKHISFNLIDYIGSEDFKYCINKLDKKQITLKCGRFDMPQMSSDIIASQQNPEDPRSVFQQCLLKMGKATSSKNKISLKKWGTKALKAAQQSGSQSFLATAYLVYAGFTMQFKSKETLDLLGKGEKLAEMACDNKEAEAPTVLMQIYGYYSAYYSIIGKRRTSCEWSLKQAGFAATNNLKEYAITIYRHTAQLAIKSYTTIYRQALSEAYAVSLDISDEHISSTEIQIIAYHYVKDLYETKQLEQAQEVEHRMESLFGSEWKDGVPSLRDKHAQMNMNLTKV